MQRKPVTETRQGTRVMKLCLLSSGSSSSGEQTQWLLSLTLYYENVTSCWGLSLLLTITTGLWIHVMGGASWKFPSVTKWNKMWAISYRRVHWSKSGTSCHILPPCAPVNEWYKVCAISYRHVLQLWSSTKWVCHILVLCLPARESGTMFVLFSKSVLIGYIDWLVSLEQYFHFVKFCQ